MKNKWFLLFFCLFSSWILVSQEINCAEKQKQIASFIDEKDFKQANVLFKEIKPSCSTKSEDFYKLGIKIFQYNLAIASSENKETAIKELLKLYDLYDKNFPENKNGNSINKAMLLYDNGIANQDEIYSNLNIAFQKDKFQFSNANALYIYFQIYKDKYSNKTNNISFNDLVDKYGQVLIVIETNKNAFREKAVEFENAKLAINSIVKDDFNKENLVKYAESNYKNNVENLDWLSSTAILLLEKATETAIFGEIANTLNSLNSTSKSLYYLAAFNLKNRNQDKAIDFLEQSAEKTLEINEKTQIYYSLATLLAAKDKSKSSEFIKKAIALDPNRGDFYMLLSSLYSNSISECASTEIEKKAIYHLAKITAEKGARAEQKYKASLAQIAKQYQKYDLTPNEIKAIKKQGGSVKINCWINENVQF